MTRLPRRDGPSRILEVLLRADAQVVPTADLVTSADIATVRALRTHLSVLRARRGDRAECVEGVRGLGYRWHDTSTPQLRADKGTAVLDTDTGMLTAGGQTVRLTPLQAALVRVLSQSRLVTISAHELQPQIGTASAAAVKVHASAARHALRQVLPGAIVGVRGEGFRYEGPPVEYVSTRVRTRPAPEASSTY